MHVEISVEGIPPFNAHLDDSGSETSRSFREALPINGRIMRWGDEICTYVDFQAPLERGARSAMKVGEMAYWPNGSAIAIFFGPTPASRGREPEAASECNVIGRTDAPPESLRKARDGARIIITLKK